MEDGRKKYGEEVKKDRRKMWRADITYTINPFFEQRRRIRNCKWDNVRHIKRFNTCQVCETWSPLPARASERPPLRFNSSRTVTTVKGFRVFRAESKAWRKRGWWQKAKEGEGKGKGRLWVSWRQGRRRGNVVRSDGNNEKNQSEAREWMWGKKNVMICTISMINNVGQDSMDQYSEAKFYRLQSWIIIWHEVWNASDSTLPSSSNALSQMSYTQKSGSKWNITNVE